LDRRYTTMWCNVYIMQLTTELHVSNLQDHNRAYKIMVLTKAHAHVPLLIPLTFWRRNYFFLILAHTVYKMRIIQEPNTLDL